MDQVDKDKEEINCWKFILKRDNSSDDQVYLSGVYSVFLTFLISFQRFDLSLFYRIELTRYGRNKASRWRRERRNIKKSESESLTRR